MLFNSQITLLLTFFHPQAEAELLQATTVSHTASRSAHSLSNTVKKTLLLLLLTRRQRLSGCRGSRNRCSLSCSTSTAC
jgi:hypothetical protein